MSFALGDSIRQAREAQGLEQAELARRLGVSQQTISRWERGQARPRSDVLTTLSSVLGMRLDEVVTAAADLSALSTDGTVDAVVAPLVPTLPIDKLAWDRFEHFVADLAHCLHPRADVHLVGGQGHTQGGIDVEVRQAGQTIAAFQCKRHAEFGPAKVAAAVDAVTVDAERHYIVLTRVASPKARNEIATHAGWDLWDIHDVARIVRQELDRDTAVRLVDTYFPGWRERFLGVRAPGAWLTLDDFAKPLATSQLFTHRWPLAGRANVLSEARDFATAGDAPAALLVGRGGVGKTRLLLETAAECERAGVTVRFLDTGADVAPEAFEQLPTSDHLLVAVDDAHDHDRLGEVLAGLRRCRPRAKLLLAARPHGEVALAGHLRRSGIDTSECARWELGDLTIADARELAASVLGSQSDPAVAARVGALTADCPLITVIASALIRDGKLDPDRFETDDGVRGTVLNLFHDVLVAHGADTRRREVLDAIVATQPYRVSDPSFRGVLEKLVGQPYDRLVPVMRDLEDAGVLLRRGDALRVVPDLLGDLILARACYDDAARAATGYLDRVRKAATAAPLRNLFVNAGRLDWQISTVASGAPSLSDQLWDVVERQFEDAGLFARRELLAMVERAAIYRPDRAIHLARWAVRHPTDRVEQDLADAGLPAPTYDQVLQNLPPILRQVAAHPDHLADAADLLWALAQHDQRLVNAHPDHALRVLADLAGFEPGKPTSYTAVIVEAASRWLDEPTLGQRSPFDALQGVLATEGFTTTSTASAVQLHPFEVEPAAVRGLRARVIDLALREATSHDPIRAVRGVKAIEESQRYPMGLLGCEPSARERDEWTPEFVDTMQRLRPMAASPSDPVVAIAVRQALSWHARYSDTETRAEALETLAALPDDLDHEIALALHDGWGHLVDEPGTDYAAVESARRKTYEALAAATMGAFTDGELARTIATRLQVGRSALADSGHSAPFLAVLVKSRPAIAAPLCELALREPASLGANDLAIVLASLAETELGGEAVALARRLAATGDILRVRAVAMALGSYRGSRDEILDGELELLIELATVGDEATRRAVAHAARLLAPAHRTMAVRLLAAIPFADSSAVAADVLGTFGARGPLTWSDLSPAKAEALLEQLTTCPSIDDFELEQFLLHLGRTEARTLVDLLVSRVDHAAALRKEREFGYRPLPYTSRHALVSRDNPDLVMLLNRIRDWLAKHAESSAHQFWGPMVFRAVAGAYDEVVLDVIERGLHTPSPSNARAAASILRLAPRSILFERVDFVRRFLALAAMIGSDTTSEVGNALHAAALSGVRMGTPGQPFREDLEQRDRAGDIARSLPVGSIEHRFYRSLEASAVQNMRWAEERDEQFMDHRDW